MMWWWASSIMRYFLKMGGQAKFGLRDIFLRTVVNSCKITSQKDFSSNIIYLLEVNQTYHAYLPVPVPVGIGRHRRAVWCVPLSLSLCVAHPIRPSSFALVGFKMLVMNWMGSTINTGNRQVTYKSEMKWLLMIHVLLGQSHQMLSFRETVIWRWSCGICSSRRMMWRMGYHQTLIDSMKRKG